MHTAAIAARERLLAQAESLDKAEVAFAIRQGQVLEKTVALTNEEQESAA